MLFSSSKNTELATEPVLGRSKGGCGAAAAGSGCTGNRSANRGGSRTELASQLEVGKVNAAADVVVWGQRVVTTFARV